MSEFAIIKTGGKQYKVKVNDVLKVEKLKEDKEITFTDLLYGKKVFAKITSNGKLGKIKILKQEAKKRYKKITGHRQNYTEIKIESIN